MTRESHIEKGVNAYADSIGIIHLKMRPAVVGYPDDGYFGHSTNGRTQPPRVAFIEFKAPGKVPSPIQEYRIATLRQRGFPVGVIENVDDGIKFLNSVFLG